MNNFIPARVCFIFLLSLVFLNSSGCQTAYYKTMEKFGIHKRDILVDRVKEARDSQEAAKEQFKTALEKFSSVVEFKGGELQEKYDQLNAEYIKSEKHANAVSSRIKSVESVSGALFDEWEEELKQYTSDTLRRSSEKKLRKTKEQYELLIGAMKRAEKKIGPVLAAFHDQVLFLKHNLNAQAISSLRGELVSIESDVASLIKEMEASIGEADAFIQSMAE